jgi:hypothetical protein
MPNLLMCDYRASSVATYCVNGGTVNQLGGDLHRETSTGDGIGSRYRTESNLAIQMHNRIFRWHVQRIYEFDSSAYYIPLSSLSGGFTFSAGGAWTASGGASGTFAEDFVAGDTHAIILVSSGTVASSETLTVTTGSHTATVDANQTQGGGVGYEGEWKVVYTIAATLASALAVSGLYAAPVNGLTKVAGVFLDNTATPEFGSILFDPVADTWTETTTLLPAPAATSTEIGSCTVANGNIIGQFRGNSATTYTVYTFSYSLSANTVSTSTYGYVNANMAGQYQSEMPHNIVEWQGRVFVCQGLVDGQFFRLWELVGGTWVVGFQVGAYAGFPRYNINGDPFNGNPSRMWVQDDCLYVLHMSWRTSGALNRGWLMDIFAMVGGTITAVTMSSAQPQMNLGIYALPAGLAQDNATAVLTNSGEHRWKVYKDQEATDPAPYTTSVTLWHTFDTDSGGYGAYTYTGLRELTDVTYTWNGTTTVTISGASSVAVNDWIGLPGDSGQVFRVTAVNAGVDLTITNPNSLTIPSGTGCVTLSPLALIGSPAGTSEMGQSETTSYGGGQYAFTPGEYDVKIESVAPAVGGQEIRYRPFGGGTVTIDLFYSSLDGGEVDSAATLSTPSQGSISGTSITGVTADGALKTVKWETVTDGVSNGDLKTILMKIS